MKKNETRKTKPRSFPRCFCVRSTFQTSTQTSRNSEVQGGFNETPSVFFFETNAVMNLFILRGSPGCLLRSEAVPSIYDLIGSERIASYCWRIVRGQ